MQFVFFQANPARFHFKTFLSFQFATVSNPIPSSPPENRSRTRQIPNLLDFASTFLSPGGRRRRAEFKRHICTRATRERVKSARNHFGRPLRLEILEQGQVQLFRSVRRVPGVSTLSTQPSSLHYPCPRIRASRR